MGAITDLKAQVAPTHQPKVLLQQQHGHVMDLQAQLARGRHHEGVRPLCAADARVLQCGHVVQTQASEIACVCVFVCVCVTVCVWVGV